MDREPIIGFLVYPFQIRRTYIERRIIFSAEIHSVEITVQYIFRFFPTAKIIITDSFTAQFHTTFGTNQLAHFRLVVQINMNKIIIRSTCGILTNARTFTDFIQIDQNVSITRIGFVQCFRIIQISLAQAIDNTRTILISTLFYI